MYTPAENSKRIAQYALDNVGGPYIFGATAKECTPAYRRARIKQYPEYEAKITKNCPVLSGKRSTCDGCKHQGKKAHDCAQLTRFAAQAAGLTLPSGATSQWGKGDWAMKGEIGTLPRNVVAFLYKESAGKMQHTGVYLGDGTVADSRSHDFDKGGVLHKSVDSYKWTHWAILNGMELPSEVPSEQPPVDVQYKLGDRVLQNGSQGEDVRALQEALLREGYDLGRYGADGKYGSETLSAVRAFQSDHGLKPDGIAGPMTLNALRQTEDDEPDDDEDEDKPVETPDGPQEPLNNWDTLSIEEKVEDLHKWRLSMTKGG